MTTFKVIIALFLYTLTGVMSEDILTDEYNGPLPRWSRILIMEAIWPIFLWYRLLAKILK